MHFIKRFEKLYLCLHSGTWKALKEYIWVEAQFLRTCFFFLALTAPWGGARWLISASWTEWLRGLHRQDRGPSLEGALELGGHICWQEGRIRGLLKDVLNQINDLVFQMCSCSSSYQNWSFSLFSFVIRMWQTSHSRVFLLLLFFFSCFWPHREFYLHMLCSMCNV